MSEAIQERIMQSARSWIGTPYMHAHALKGAQGGCDCLGLIRGVYKEVYGLSEDPEKVPNYTPTWRDFCMDDPLKKVCAKYFDPVEAGSWRSYLATRDAHTNIILFRMSPDMAAKHCAIVSRPGRGRTLGDMIHAYSLHDVCETPLSIWWIDKIAGVYKWRQ